MLKIVNGTVPRALRRLGEARERALPPRVGVAHCVLLDGFCGGGIMYPIVVVETLTR